MVLSAIGHAGARLRVSCCTGANLPSTLLNRRLWKRTHVNTAQPIKRIEPPCVLCRAESFVGAANAVVTATVTNTGDETVRVLNDPATVLGKVPTDVFVISNEDGTRPGFQGVAVKYIPDLQDVTTLEPGQSVSVEHSLGEAYDFSASGAGLYTIDTSPLFHIVGSGGLEDTHATVVAHSVRLSGDLVATAHQHTKRAQFVGCSSSWRPALNTASQAANLLVGDAVSYLADTLTDSSRFTTWFGDKTDTSFATVQTHFGLLKTLNFSTFTYDCTCSDLTIVAKTSPKTPRQITICPPYIDLDTTGTNSQAGVLIQQAVQWNIIGGLGTFATGVQACLDLANNKPNVAVENADSHEYFAENALV